MILPRKVTIQKGASVAAIKCWIEVTAIVDMIWVAIAFIEGWDRDSNNNVKNWLRILEEQYQFKCKCVVKHHKTQQRRAKILPIHDLKIENLIANNEVIFVMRVWVSANYNTISGSPSCYYLLLWLFCETCKPAPHWLFWSTRRKEHGSRISSWGRRILAMPAPQTLPLHFTWNIMY
jgi:hypothetical protein